MGAAMNWEPPIGWVPEDPPIPGFHLVSAEHPSGQIRAALGDLYGSLTACAGGCGAQVVRFVHWEKLDKTTRKRLISLGVKRIQSYGRCWKCTEAGNGKGPKPDRKKKVSDEQKAQIPQVWEQITLDGGGTPELGAHLGVTRERARQLVKELGLPHRDGRGRRTEEFIEELEFLAGFCLGVKELADKFGLTPDKFVSKVEQLRIRGLTDLSYTEYHRHAA